MRTAGMKDIIGATTPSHATSSAPDWIAALRVHLLATAGANLLWETAHLPLYII